MVTLHSYTSSQKDPMNDIRYLAELLDTKFKLPNGWRFGWDGILGLIPGIGNIITDAVSFYILFRAAILGCPPIVILHMALNVVIDNILDKIPGLGLLFDFMWKSNTKNIQLMDNYFANPHLTKKTSGIVLALTLIGVFSLFVILAVSTIWLLATIFTEFYKTIPG
tara:strand:- start:58603 stop:59100 length:498 start_codon:yes stop_codon:yes gene_type:complete